jgi:hypothetical protein
MHLGIDQQSGLVYEGVDGPDLPVFPAPSVTLAKLISEPADWERLPINVGSSHTAWVFREDSFDAASRTRRGRLYEPWGSQHGIQYRVAPNAFDLASTRSAGSDGRIPRTLYRYQGCTALLAMKSRGQGLTLALGTPRAASAWLITQTELLASQAVMVTLKAKTAFGLLPEIDEFKVPQEYRADVAKVIDATLDAAFRAPAASVIDHCRDALQVILSRWLAKKNNDSTVLTADLGKIARSFDKEGANLLCVNRLADVVAKLHARAKTNQQVEWGGRPPVDEDAELALQCLGFAIREIGWARA